MDIIRRYTKTETSSGSPTGYKKQERCDLNAMVIDAMTTEKQTTFMRKGLCFLCKKNKKKKMTKEEPTPSPQNMKKIFAILQSLSKKEKEELDALHKGEESDNEDF